MSIKEQEARIMKQKQGAVAGSIAKTDSQGRKSRQGSKSLSRELLDKS